MAEVIRMPRLSDTMAEGKIIGWNKKVGDVIKPGDVLAEVETDKATMELESYNEGTLLHIGVEAGNAAKVDAVLAVVGKAGEDYSSALQKENPASGSDTKPANKTAENAVEKKPTASDTNLKAGLPEGAKDIRMPLLSDTMTEGKIISWNKKIGDHVKADDVLAEVETDKATMDVVGYEEGTLLYVGVEAGKAAKINQIIAIVGKPGTDVSAYVAAESSGAVNAAAEKKNAEPAGSTAPKTTSSSDTPSEGKPEADSQRVKASPLAKKLATEKGVDIARVNGTGDGGRVIRRDIDSYQPSNGDAQSKTKADPGKSAQPQNYTPSVAGQESHTDIPLSQMRTVIARRLGESMFSAPHFYLTMEMKMDNSIAARKMLNEMSPVKISFNDLLIKACAMALKQHPAINSSWMGDFIRQNHHIHIGSAIALPEGLIVPVIKFADQLSLSQIAGTASDLYQRARDKKLQPAEFSGNTFTISNLGMMDIEEFTAIINPPDSCILAVGRIKETVVKTDNGFGVSNFMKVTLSCDHRSVDGATGAAFLQTLKRMVENPITMLV